MSQTFLGIDTSNYTTSLSVCKDGEITENIRIPLPVAAGEAGLRQSDAVFHHTVNIPQAFSKLGTDLKNMSAIGCDVRPRDAECSYMPCFLSGRAVACALSKTLGVPMYEYSHQANHIKAAVYSAKMPVYDNFYAYHLSGGTFELLKVSPDARSYEVKIVGGTLDTTAGQIIDRVGVALGLSFPCGAQLERLADENIEPLPKVRPSVKGTSCNLSGLQNIAQKYIKERKSKPFVAAYTMKFIIQTLDLMTSELLAEQRLPLLFSGGVASNGAIRAFFTEKYGAYFAPGAYSADNACGAALLCRDEYIKETLI